MSLVILVVLVAALWTGCHVVSLAWRTAREIIMWLYYSIDEYLIEQDAIEHHGCHFTKPDPTAQKSVKKCVDRDV